MRNSAPKPKKTYVQENPLDTSNIFKINSNNKLELISNIVVPSGTTSGSAVNKGQLDTTISAEALLRENADAELSERIDALNQNFASKEYVDIKVADVVNNAPAILDTLKELADAIGNDPSFYLNIATTFASLNSQITLLQNKLDSLTTSIVAQKETFVVSSSILASNYIDLAETVAEESLMVFIDRVPVHINEDYTLSTADNKTRITFINSDDATFYLENDKIYAQYFSADFDYDIEFVKDKYVLTAQDMALGYVDLSDEASDESLTAFLGRIALHQGEDYLLSYVNGVTRFTFINNDNNNFFAEGESLYIQYYSKVQ
jgi:hypothetical protein